MEQGSIVKVAGPLVVAGVEVSLISSGFSVGIAGDARRRLRRATGGATGTSTAAAAVRERRDTAAVTPAPIAASGNSSAISRCRPSFPRWRSVSSSCRCCC